MDQRRAHSGVSLRVSRPDTLPVRGFGYKPENADAPLGVELVTTIAAIAVFLVPCVTAVLYGSQAHRVGDRKGLLPMGIGAIAGCRSLS